MNDFKVGDWVYAGSWCYGQIVELTDDGVAHVEFETYGGGGTMPFDIEELYHAEPPKPPRNIDLLDVDKLVNAVFELLNAYDRGLWEDIQYADLAEVWVDALNSEGYRMGCEDRVLKEALREFILTKCR